MPENLRERIAHTIATSVYGCAWEHLTKDSQTSLLIGADAILALTPVEGVGDDDLLKRSASAEQAYANMYPENAAMIASIIDGYRFDTPSDRARAHEVARAMAGHPRDTPVAAQGDEVREALTEVRDWLDGDAIGSWPYMEGGNFYTDKTKMVERLDAALATLGAPHEG